MGDIELHVRSSDWQAHHHHLNPAYNRVILHVVIWHDSDTPARRQDGKCLPVLAVHRYLETPPPQLREGEDPASGCSLPCLDAAERLTPHTIAAILDKAGRERFLFHVARFQAELSQTEAGEVLYRGIMGAWVTARTGNPLSSWPAGCPSMSWNQLSRMACRTGNTFPGNRQYCLLPRG
jgi:hypothetical protein